MQRAEQDGAVDEKPTSDLDFAYFAALPIGHPFRRHLDENDTCRIYAVVEPLVEIAGPMTFEGVLVSD
jgi:hypothetical protein